MAAWRHGTKENFPLKHRHDRERKETADREHRREATHVSFSRSVRWVYLLNKPF